MEDLSVSNYVSRLLENEQKLEAIIDVRGQALNAIKEENENLKTDIRALKQIIKQYSQEGKNHDAEWQRSRAVAMNERAQDAEEKLNITLNALTRISDDSGLSGVDGLIFAAREALKEVDKISAEMLWQCAAKK